jgi:hypothetical protein
MAIFAVRENESAIFAVRENESAIFAVRENESAIFAVRENEVSREKKGILQKRFLIYCRFKRGHRFWGCLTYVPQTECQS